MTDHSAEAAIAVTRFGLGARPGEIAQVAADPRGWLHAQVHREGADPLPGEWPSAGERYAALRDFRQAYQKVRMETAAAPSAAPVVEASPPHAMAVALAPAMGERRVVSDVMLRRRELVRPLNQATAAELLARFQLAVSTPAGFRERWTLFWSNHFTVASKSEEAGVLAPVFEREAIRPHVFGRFADLLFASTTHPGMMAYLDQTRSVGPNSPLVQRAALRRGPHASSPSTAGLNENLAREVMELHTVGADAGYTQADVTEFARALTGYSIASGREEEPSLGTAVFREAAHEPGARTVMGRTYRDDEARQARAVVDDLAAHPATARRLARKLATHFVSDAPDPALEARLEAVFVRTHGDLGAVALALVDAPQAWAPPARKLKTPYEFLVSAWRAADARPTLAPQEVLQPLATLGQRPFAAPQPNGWPDQAVS